MDALALANEPKPDVSGAVMRFRTMMDERVCSVCGPLNGEIYPYDQPSRWMVPPVHPNCRCLLEFEEWEVIPYEDRDVKLEVTPPELAPMVGLPEWMFQ